LPGAAAASSRFDLVALPEAVKTTTERRWPRQVVPRASGMPLVAGERPR
jgi:hypothetical protein